MFLVSNSTFMVVSIVVSLLLATIVIVYLARNIVLGSQQKLVILSTPTALNAPTQTTLSAVNMPNAPNGNAFSYSFWLKLTAFDFTSTHKPIWYRSASATNAIVSPMVLLDAATNQLYVLIATNRTQTVTGVNGPLQISDVVGSSIADIQNNMSFAVATLGYFPMNTWAHIGIIANDQYLAITLDGTLTSSGTINTLSNATGPRPYVLPAAGTFYVGGNANLQGSITRLTFANYAMSPEEMQADYKLGVTGSGLASLGLPQYALRSPIYRIS